MLVRAAATRRKDGGAGSGRRHPLHHGFQFGDALGHQPRLRGIQVLHVGQSARAVGIGRGEGFTKLVFDEKTHRIVGGAIVGVQAGDLICEIALAIEMGAEAADIGHTIHPHPTLGETVGMAAEVYEGTITDLYIPKKK